MSTKIYFVFHDKTRNFLHCPYFVLFKLVKVDGRRNNKTQIFVISIEKV